MQTIVVIQKFVQDNRSWIIFIHDKQMVQNEKSSEHTCSKKILNTGTYSSNSSNFSVKVQTKTMKYDHEVSLYRFDLAKYSCRTKFYVEIHFAQKYIKQKYHYLLLKLFIHTGILRIVLYLIVLLTMLHLTRLL